MNHKLRICHKNYSDYPYEKITQRVLYIQMLDWDRFSRNDPIGEVSDVLTLNLSQQLSSSVYIPSIDLK